MHSKILVETVDSKATATIFTFISKPMTRSDSPRACPFRRPDISRLSLAALLLVAFALPIRAGSPRDDLLRLVPEDVGFCLAIQDLRGHSDAFLRSPFTKKWWESPIGKAISSAPEHKKLIEFEAQLKQ